MRRQVNIEEISDGRLYTVNDMVKADCQDCKGCSACCSGMGTSIVLDPLDVYRLTKELGKSFQELLKDSLELNTVDGLILPNLKMTGAKEACIFLNEEGRCTIHKSRPGICRLFPLGRIYEDGTFMYFLQVHECANKQRSKIKVKKWIDEPDLKKHETFINHWHYYLKQYQVSDGQEFQEEQAKKASMHILTEFYMKPYDTSMDFYEQYWNRKFDME